MPKSGAGAAIEIDYKLRLNLTKTGYQIIPPFKKPVALLKEFIGITRPVAVIRAKQRFKLVWAVINYTDRTLQVELDQFVDTTTGAAAQPVQFGPNANPKTVPPYSVEAIKGKVKGNAASGKYSYRILIDGRPALDPELEIDPPGTIVP